MPRITSFKKVVLDQIDRLIFNQTFVWAFIDISEIEWLEYISTTIDTSIEERTSNPNQAATLKHYVVCSLEIMLGLNTKYWKELLETNEGPVDTDTYLKVLEHDRNFSLGLLFSLAKQNGVDTKLLQCICDEILFNKELNIENAPNIIKFRLSERLLACQFPISAILFYQQSIDLGLLDCSKYRGDKLSSKKKSDAEILFLRACLLIEFNILRESWYSGIKERNIKSIEVPIPESSISSEKKKELAKYYKDKIDNLFLRKDSVNFLAFKVNEKNNISYLSQFLSYSDNFIKYPRIFTGTQGKVIGNLGASFIEMSIHHHFRNNISFPIYSESNNNGTISDKTMQLMKSYGFTISSRSLYLRHKEYKKLTKDNIKLYTFMLYNNPMLVSWDNPDRSYLYAFKYKNDT